MLPHTLEQQIIDHFWTSDLNPVHWKRELVRVCHRWFRYLSSSVHVTHGKPVDLAKLKDDQDRLFNKYNLLSYSHSFKIPVTDNNKLDLPNILSARVLDRVAACPLPSILMTLHLYSASTSESFEPLRRLLARESRVSIIAYHPYNPLSLTFFSVIPAGSLVSIVTSFPSDATPMISMLRHHKDSLTMLYTKTYQAEDSHVLYNQLPSTRLAYGAESPNIAFPELDIPTLIRTYPGLSKRLKLDIITPLDSHHLLSFAQLPSTLATLWLTSSSEDLGDLSVLLQSSRFHSLTLSYRLYTPPPPMPAIHLNPTITHLDIQPQVLTSLPLESTLFLQYLEITESNPFPLAIIDQSPSLQFFQINFISLTPSFISSLLQSLFSHRNLSSLSLTIRESDFAAILSHLSIASPPNLQMIYFSCDSSIPSHPLFTRMSSASGSTTSIKQQLIYLTFVHTAFSAQENKMLTPELVNIIDNIAKTGVTCYPWVHLRDLLYYRLEQNTIQSMTTSPSSSSSSSPLSPTATSDKNKQTPSGGSQTIGSASSGGSSSAAQEMKDDEMLKIKNQLNRSGLVRIKHQFQTRFKEYKEPPFTIQRLCELIVDYKIYTSFSKYLCAVEKMGTVTSTLPPLTPSEVIEYNSNLHSRMMMPDQPSPNLVSFMDPKSLLDSAEIDERIAKKKALHEALYKEIQGHLTSGIDIAADDLVPKIASQQQPWGDRTCMALVSRSPLLSVVFPRRLPFGLLSPPLIQLQSSLNTLIRLPKYRTLIDHQQMIDSTTASFRTFITALNTCDRQALSSICTESYLTRISGPLLTRLEATRSLPQPVAYQFNLDNITNVTRTHINYLNDRICKLGFNDYLQESHTTYVTGTVWEARIPKDRQQPVTDWKLQYVCPSPTGLMAIEWLAPALK
eukprot:gene3889-4499_t